MTGQTRGAGAATLRATCTPGVRAEPLILEDDVWSGLDADDADDAGPSEALVATIQLGGRVGAMAFEGDGEHLYAAQPDSIAVINRSHLVVGRIAIPSEVKDLYLTPSTERLLAVHYAGSVSSINVVEQTVKTIASGWNSDMVFSPDSRFLYAAHNHTEVAGESVLAKIDADGALVDSLRLPGDINALAISPDGSELYTISSQAGWYYQHAAGRLDVIDTDAYAVSDTIAVAADPVTVTVSPDGARLYLTHDDIAGITTIELSTHRAVEVCLDEVPLSVTFSPDSTHAYMPHLSSLTVIDTVTLEKTRISTGELPRGVLFSPDGKRAYITNIGDHAVTVVDTVTGSVATTLAVGGNPEAMAASPDDERLYVGDYWSGTIAVIARPSVQDEPEPSTDQA